MTSKRVLVAKPRGYCAGVDRAVEAVERALEQHGAPVYVRKQIVHNVHVVETLTERGAIFVDDTDEVPEGAIVVFSAHGVSPAVREQARARQLRTIDATCPLVTKVHQEAKRFAREGYDILLVGHAGHEEVEGTVGRGARAHPARRDRGRRGEGHRARSGEGRVAVADHAVGRRDHGDGRRPARAPARPAEPAERRHLLRHAEPADRGEGDGAAVRPRARRRVGELVQLGAARRGGAAGRCRGVAPHRLRPPDRRGLARRRRARSASRAARRCPRCSCAVSSSTWPSAGGPTSRSSRPPRRR